MSIIPAAVVGALSWTAAEYGLHRFAMHEKLGPEMASTEHLSHHADVTYFSPTWKKLLSAAGTTSVALPVAWVTVGRRDACAFTTGMITAYFGYEVLHRRIHTHAPRTAYGRRVRLDHFSHHFGAPRRNMGVTSSVWDRVFRTYDEPGVVTVPRRMAPVWLLDAQGKVRPEYQHEYRVKGRAAITTTDVARDRDDAFANRAPIADPDLDADRRTDDHAAA